jgi:hypothetical protein
MVRLQAEITGTVGTTPEVEVKLPDSGPARCEYFYLANTDAANTLYWSGFTGVSTSSMPLAAGKTILIAAGLTKTEGVFLLGSAADTSYAIMPVG